MPAYWVARSRIIDPVEYKKYTDLVPGIVARHGGKVLARGGKFRIMEGPERFHRFIVIEFPTFEQAVSTASSSSNFRPSNRRLPASPRPNTARRRRSGATAPARSRTSSSKEWKLEFPTRSFRPSAVAREPEPMDTILSAILWSWIPARAPPHQVRGRLAGKTAESIPGLGGGPRFGA